MFVPPGKLFLYTGKSPANPRQSGGKDISAPAIYVHNENPSLVALGKNGMKTSFSEWYGNAGMKTRVRKGYENDKSKANKPVYENTVWKHARKHPYENMV